MTKVIAISPVFNRIELTLACLESLFAADLDGIELEVIIVDDGSTDGTTEKLKAKYPQISIVPGTGNLWYTGGINYGLRAALKRRSDFILAFNNDSSFDKKFLRSMVETALRVPRSVVGATLISAGKVFQVSPEWRLSWGGWRHWHQQTLETIPNMPWEVDIVVGNCMLLPTDAVREAGLMDETRLVHFGDAEYTPRMKKLGWKLLIDPNALVFCKPNDPPESLSKLSAGKLFRALFLNPYHPHSLKRRYYTTLSGAPNVFYAVAAVAVSYARALVGKSVEKVSDTIEQPLSERFKARIVKIP